MKYAETDLENSKYNYSIKKQNYFINMQSYPQRMRLQRRLYGNDSACFMIPCTSKLVSFFVQSVKMPKKD